MTCQRCFKCEAMPGYDVCEECYDETDTSRDIDQTYPGEEGDDADDTDDDDDRD